MQTDSEVKIEKIEAGKVSSLLDCYAFGDRVNCTHRFVRKERRVENKNGYGSTSWKIWGKKSYSVSSGIFLGYRTLKDGTRNFKYDAGWIFTPKKYFKAALICPTDKINPVFVPLDCIEA